MNHAHHHHPESAQPAGARHHRMQASLLSSPLLVRLAIAGAMAGIMWLTIGWSLA